MNIELEVDSNRPESEQIQIAVMGLLDEDKEDLVLWVIDVSCRQLNSLIRIQLRVCKCPPILSVDSHPFSSLPP